MIIPTYLPYFVFTGTAIGLLAPVVGVPMRERRARPLSLVAAWNVLGILDLIIAVGTSFMAAPSRFLSLEVQPASELMTALSMVLIPVYLVALSIVLHLASLAKLRREAPVGHGKIVGARA